MCKKSLSFFSSGMGMRIARRSGKRPNFSFGVQMMTTFPPFSKRSLHNGKSGKESSKEESMTKIHLRDQQMMLIKKEEMIII